MIDDLSNPLDAPPPKRTGETLLTDDELLLLDALFQCHGIEAEQLFVDGYHWHMNVGYTHHLTDTQVLETLAHWNTQRWITPLDNGVQGAETSRQWEMCAEGAMLWEQERQPIWDRYVRRWTYYSELDDIDYTGVDAAFLRASWEEPMTVIASPTLAIAETYLETAIAAKIVLPCSFERQYTVLHGEKEAHKVFDDLHCLFTPTVSEAEETSETEPPYIYRADWKMFKRNRIWWNTIAELETLTHPER